MGEIGNRIFSRIEDMGYKNINDFSHQIAPELELSPVTTGVYLHNLITMDWVYGSPSASVQNKIEKLKRLSKVLCSLEVSVADPLVTMINEKDSTFENVYRKVSYSMRTHKA